MRTDPDVVRNRSKCIVAAVDVEDGAKTVLDIVAATRLELNPVKIKPGAPERATEEVDVAIDTSTSIVAEADVNLRLDIEVHNAYDATGGQQRRERVDDRVVVRLQEISQQEM